MKSHPKGAPATARGSALALVLALVIGLLGGGLFNLLSLPLPWMLGAIAATTIAAVGGLPVAVPGGVRQPMLAILGIALGSAFSPVVLERAGGWWLSLAALLPLIALSTAVGTMILRRWFHCDGVTAFFTATPGGLNEMVAVGTALGGDERMIALAHSLRIFLVVLLIPLWFQLFGGYLPGARGPLGPPLMSLPIDDALMLALCLVAIPLALRLRLPAAMLLGPLLASAGLHATSLTTARPPGLLIALAQVVIGAAIGSRFAGIAWARIRQSLTAALILTVIMLGLGALAAASLSGPTGAAVSALMLAFAPGGLAEMSLVALALGIDVAFVASHHVVRVLMIVLVAPAVFALSRRWGGRGPTVMPPAPGTKTG